MYCFAHFHRTWPVQSVSSLERFVGCGFAVVSACLQSVCLVLAFMVVNKFMWVLDRNLHLKTYSPFEKLIPSGIKRADVKMTSKNPETPPPSVDESPFRVKVSLTPCWITGTVSLLTHPLPWSPILVWNKGANLSPHMKWTLPPLE